MADVEHKNLTDPELHEPKGIATAGNGEVYRANGAGTGVWTPTVGQGYGCLRKTASQVSSGMSTTYQPINTATLGIDWSGVVQDIHGDVQGDVPGGYLYFADGGVYQMNISLSVRGTTSQARHYKFTIGVDPNSIGTIQDQSAVIQSYVTTRAADQMEAVSLACFPSFISNSKVYLMVATDTGNVSELEFRAINMTMQRVN
jgi:hypothetical protein